MFPQHAPAMAPQQAATQQCDQSSGKPCPLSARNDEGLNPGDHKSPHHPDPSANMINVIDPRSAFAPSAGRERAIKANSGT
jgi:hypothetical protein